MKLIRLLSEALTEVTTDLVQKQLVDTGRLSQKDFDEIKKVSKNKSGYITWLAKKVADKQIKSEDIYKYADYFETYDKYKGKKGYEKKFKYKDIGQYKTAQDVADFKKEVTDVRNATSGEGADVEDEKKHVSEAGKQELASVGIEFLGMVDGYQCFKIPKKLAYDEDAWKIYRKWLAHCKGREQGQKVSICTMANFDHFNTYLGKDDLYVFYNLNDPRSPYQFSYYEDDPQFMDKDDGSILDYTGD